MYSIYSEKDKSRVQKQPCCGYLNSHYRHIFLNQAKLTMLAFELVHRCTREVRGQRLKSKSKAFKRTEFAHDNVQTKRKSINPVYIYKKTQLLTLKRRLKYTTPLSFTYLCIRHLCQPSRKEAYECARRPEDGAMSEVTP